MAVADRVSQAELGKTFAEAIREEPAAKQLWVRSHRDYFELWLLTEPIDSVTERRLYAAGLLLHDRFPQADVRLRILNPRLFADFEPSELIPEGAEGFPLRPA